MDVADEKLVTLLPASADKVAPAHRRRRWFQFRLRTLLIVLTTSALLFAFFGTRSRRQHEAEMAALRGLEAVGFIDSFESSWIRRPKAEKRDLNQDLTDAKCLASVSAAKWLDWLPETWQAELNDSVFGRVRVLSMLEPRRIKKFDEDEIRHLSALTSLQQLSIGGRILDRHDMARLAAYADLTRLDLIGCTFEPRAFEPIGELHGLRALYLDGSNVSDEDLVALAGLPELVVLDLSHTLVTDEGLAHLRSLFKLRELELSGSRVTDMGIEQLRQSHPQLQMLDD